MTRLQNKIKTAKEGTFFIKCLTHTLKKGDRPIVWGHIYSVTFEDAKKAFEDATDGFNAHKFMFIYRVEHDHKKHICAIWANDLEKFITTEEFIKSIK